MLDKICHNNVSKHSWAQKIGSLQVLEQRRHTAEGCGGWHLEVHGKSSFPESRAHGGVCPELMGVTPVGSRLGWKQWSEMLGHAVLSWAYRVRCSWHAARQKTWPSAPQQSFYMTFPQKVAWPWGRPGPWEAQLGAISLQLTPPALLGMRASIQGQECGSGDIQIFFFDSMNNFSFFLNVHLAPFK